jgi:hypothetical protein
MHPTKIKHTSYSFMIKQETNTVYKLLDVTRLNTVVKGEDLTMMEKVITFTKHNFNYYIKANHLVVFQIYKVVKIQTVWSYGL